MHDAAAALNHGGMLRRAAILAGLLLPGSAIAQGSGPSAPPAASVALHAAYATYAAGLHVADVESGLAFGPWSYQMQFDYRTTGVIGFFYRGHEADSAYGAWSGNTAQPTRFLARGLWHGVRREADLVYQDGMPSVTQLVPPNQGERERVPDALRAHTIDTLSALAQLIRVVDRTGRCDITVHTFDGRRALEIEAHTVGQEMLPRTDRSSFSGPALRCDFQGRLLAGFELGADRAHDSQPLHGSAWLAPAVRGAPALPVRLSFETRWFGDATMYLTDAGPGADVRVAKGE